MYFWKNPLEEEGYKVLHLSRDDANYTFIRGLVKNASHLSIIFGGTKGYPFGYLTKGQVDEQGKTIVECYGLRQERNILPGYESAAYWQPITP